MMTNVLEIADEIRLAYHSMVRLGEKAHEGRAITVPMRAVLEYLDRTGPATVPGIARDRGVSRQHIQVIVNDLVDAFLVELADNPSHRRSRLVGLTSAGQTAIDEITHTEHELLEPVAAAFEPSELETTLATLTRLRCRLDELTETMER